jgi:Mycothiol maleylpyruvate isomerase N-terminal domain
MQTVQRPQTIDALVAEYGLLNDIISSLGATDLRQPSGCESWTIADLIFHMLLDAQRALVTFNTPAPGPADTDFVNYWMGFTASDEGSQSHAHFVRMSVAAHRDPMAISARWHETSSAAMIACRTSGIPLVATQGHVLALEDFIATLVVEAAIHHLDLVTNLEGRPPPAPSALSITTATLDGLMRGPRPPAWDDIAYILKATGREALKDEDRAALEDSADDIPVFS